MAAAKSSPHGTVVMTDVNRRAARLATENLGRNGISNAEVRVGPLFEPVRGERFDLIATNPPFHAGREVVTGILASAPGHLAPGGRLLLVGKGSQGIRFYQEWVRTHWGPDVRVVGRGSGYRVLDVPLPTSPGRARPEAVKKPTLLNAVPPNGRSEPRAVVRVRSGGSGIPRTGE